MTEPNWKEFKLDPKWDPPEAQINKIKAFMTAFIDWRAEAPSKSKSKKKRPKA